MANQVQIKTYRSDAFDDNPTQNDDSTKGFSAGSRWYNYPLKRMLECVDATPGTAKWVCVTNPVSNIEIIRVDHTTNSTVYEETGCSFPFMGDKISIQSLKIVALINNPDPAFTFDVQVIDETHENLVIAEAFGLASTTKDIFDLGPISNLPSSPSVFTVDVRRSGNVSADTVHVYSLQIEYV